MSRLEKRSFSNPDETRKTDRSKMETIKLGGRTVTKLTFEPGWKWSVDARPAAGTKSCMRHHYGYVLSGRMRARMDDGTELDHVAGDMLDLPPGHDGWVLGNEQAVFLDFGDPCNCE
jgi:hypothetical protein